MTHRDALTEATNRIARRDAELLLAHTLQRDRVWLLTHSDDHLDPTSLEAFRLLTARRDAHEPLQHLTGAQEFYGLALRVSPDVLIPRPETEHLVEAVLAWCSQQPAEPAKPLHILDVGTGSGAIALALATHLPSAQIHATDISLAALTIARENAAALHLSNRVTFMHSDLLTAFHAALAGGLRFDVLVSNPPYIPLSDAATMQPEVVAHEPHAALFAGPDGLDLYRRLIPEAHAALRPGGLLALEIGFGQRDALAHLLAAWSNLRFLNDYANIPRVALADRP